jgi:hypothetical protein
LSLTELGHLTSILIRLIVPKYWYRVSLKLLNS